MKRWNLRYFALYGTPAAQLVYHRKVHGGPTVPVENLLLRDMHGVACYAHAQVGEPPANSLRLRGATVRVSPGGSCT